MSYVGKVNTGQNDHLVAASVFGTCSTAADVAVKIVVLDNFDALMNGVTIQVKFVYSNTASSPTLNVNNTGAKPIYLNGTNPPGVTALLSWSANSVLSFTYDGTAWIMNDVNKAVVDAVDRLNAGYNPVSKTSGMTKAVGNDSEGKLWTEPVPAADVQTAANTWLSANITNPNSPPLDRSLSSNSSAAPADMVGDLKNTLNAIVTIDFEVDGTGYYDYPDAKLLATEQYKHTKPIALLAGVEYTFKSLNYTAVSAITLCDEDGNNRVAVVRGKYDGSGVYTEVTYTPETDCYVILSYNVGLEPHFYVVKRLDTIINTGITNKKYVTELNHAVESGSTAKPGKNLFNPETSAVGYLGSNGSTLTVYQDWYTTDYIYVHDCTNIYTSCEHSGTREALPMYFCCIYNANKECITQFNSQNNPYQIIDSVYYIRFSYHKNADINIQVENNTTFTTYEPFTLEYNFVGKKWADYKWTCMGDSLTEHNQRTRFNYHDYVSQATSIQVVNLGKSGSGYMSNPGYRFYERVSEVPIDSNVVTIFGSGNDLSYTLGEPTDTGTSTICGAINTTIDNLVTRMPRVSLGIVAPTPWEDYPPSIENNAMALYVNALKTICEMRSIPFLDLYNESNLRPWTAEGRAACYSKDDGNGTHPDEYGHKLIAPRFKAFLDELVL